MFAKHGRTAKTPSAQRACGAESAKAHQLPDDAVAHLDRAYQHQHIEDQLTHIVPYDGGCRQRIVRDGGRGRGKGREDHTGQYDDTALQTDGGIAFQKGYADTAGGLSRKAGQRDGCDGRCDIELKKAAIYRQYHDKGEYPDKERAQQRHRPKGDGVNKAHILDDTHQFIR